MSADEMELDEYDEFVDGDEAGDESMPDESAAEDAAEDAGEDGAEDGEAAAAYGQEPQPVEGDEPVPPEAEAAAADAADPEAQLDVLQITLDFALDKARMPLGEVRALGVGAIVPLGSSLPVSIAIFSAGRRLGSGEAVDIDGRLGIRITQWGPT